MTDSNQKEQTQKTPKGLEIPIPKEEDVMRDLEKLAQSKKASPPDSPKKSRLKHRRLIIAVAIPPSVLIQVALNVSTAKG